jgi:MFS transporter, OFA family, oxalate/formate antiporter
MADRRASASSGWGPVVGGTSINLVTGFLYTWSIFTFALTTLRRLAGRGPHDYASLPIAASSLGRGQENWTTTAAVAPYALALLCFAFTMVFAERLRERFGPTIVATIGGLFAGLGMLIASFSDYSARGSHALLMLGFGVVGGIGFGLACACTAPTAIKWFPARTRRGISTVMTGAIAVGSFCLAPLVARLIAGVGPALALRYLGAAFLVIIVLAAQFLRDPPSRFVAPESGVLELSDRDVRQRKVAGASELNWAAMAQTPQFYLLWLMYTFAAFAGLMMTGLIATVAPELLVPAGNTVSSSAGTAGIALASGFLLVMAFAVGNGFGRPIVGIVSDRIGRVPSMTIIFLGQAVCMALLLPNSHSLALLLVVAALIGVFYGSNLALFPAATYDFFGTKHGGVNYGLVFTAWGVGGALGNFAAGWIKDAYGSFTPAYYVAAALLLVAAVLAITVRPPRVEVSSAAEAATEAA